MDRSPASGRRDNRQAVRDSERIDAVSLSPAEEKEVARNLPPSVQVLHETVRVQGDLEMERSAAALGWSALAAGLSMGFSMLAPALLHVHLSDTPERFLVSRLGYCVGFLIVILARQQLFTENTMTAVLPFMTQPSARSLWRLLRLWGIVFAGNIVGGTLFAYGISRMQVVDAATRDAILSAGGEMMGNTVFQMFAKAILAGWLIAMMVWLVAAAEKSKTLAIVLMTYLVGLGGFAHVIVGSIEGLFMVFQDALPFGRYVANFLLPTLAGNIVGGSLIFALISHAQVRSDDG
ncbi:MAG: formate/nitrite transporter family protein [Luteimonas sp.]